MVLTQKEQRTCSRSPMEDASFFSRLTFWWLNGLFSKGYDRRLEPGDMFEVLHEDSAERLVADLESEWYKEVAAASFSCRKPSFVKAIARFVQVELIVVGIFGFLNEAIRTVQPVFLFYLVSYFMPGSRVTKLEAYLFAMGVTLASMLSVVLHQLYFFHGHRTGMHIRIATTGCVYRKALRLGQQTYSSVSTASHVVNLITTDTHIFDRFVTHLHFVWITPIQVVIIMYLLWMQLGYSCAVSLVLVLLLIFHQAWFDKKYSMLRLKTARLTEERCKTMNEIITGMKVLKISTWELLFSKLISNLRRLEVSGIHKAQLLQAFNMAIGFASQSIIACAMFIIYVILGNSLTAAKVFSSVALVTVLQRSVARHFPPAVQKLNEAKKTVRKIQAFLKLDELNFENIKHRSSLKSGQSSVVVKNVTCAWNQENISKPTLQDVTFEVNQGELCMIVGPVGSGKSSLLMMLLGELRVTKGHLCIRGRIGYVPQQAWIFSGSVRQNIVFGQTFDEDRYKKVIRACALEQDVELLPEGDWTLVGEKGVALNDGQKVRLCLARAVYYKADIYLLDDPLSAVDVRVGRKLFDECIDGIISDCPRILVTRQLQYLRNATEILYLDQGNIRGRGSYTDLANGGIDLVSLLSSRDSSNYDDDDNDSAIDEDSEPAQSLDVHGVILRRGTGAKGIKAANRWSTTSTIDIEADFEAMANKAKEKPQAEPDERPRGNIPCSLYLSYFRAGGNCLTLIMFLLVGLSAQGAFTLSDWWLSQWSNFQSEDTFLYKSLHTAFSPNTKLQSRVHIIIYGGLVAATLILSLIRALVFFNITVNSSTTFHRQLLDAVLRAPIYFFDTNPTGRILSRFSSDAAYMDSLLPQTFFDFLQLALLAVAVVIVNVIAMPFMLVGLLPLVLIFYCLRNYYLKTTGEIKRLEATARVPVLSHLTTTLQALTSIRSHDLQQLMMHEFNICQDHHTETWFLFIAASRWFASRLDFLCTLFVFMASFTPLFIAERGDMDAGMVGLCVTYALLLTGMFQWCVRQSGEVENQMMAVERIVELCHLEPEGEWYGEVSVPGYWPELGLITAEGVSFKYHPTLPRVLRNLNFCIRPQEKVGIVGHTGAGKSSLLAAILRLAEPNGTIRIDGVDITEVGLHELRSKVSFIPQDPVLFGETLRKNLDPNDEHCDADLWLALHEVRLRDTLCSLNGSLDGLLTDSGCTLSVGQRQLLYLARAILRDNKIVVMETTDIDHRTDALIQETIRRKFKNCTVLISTHRLKTIMDCDRVMVLDNGRLKEFEEPHLLLQNRLSFFSRLVEQTGALTAAQLKKAARKAYDLRHDPENTLDIIPDSARSHLSSYIPASGFTDLQLESHV